MGKNFNQGKKPSNKKTGMSKNLPGTSQNFCDIEHNLLTELSNGGNLNSSLDSEDLYQTLCRDTEDHQNAAKSFVAKQKPVFTGR